MIRNNELTCKCGKVSELRYYQKEVAFPDVKILDKMYPQLDFEIEEFYTEENGFPCGVNVTVTYHEESGRYKETRHNATEFHYMFDGYSEEEILAIESDIHYQGGTIPVNAITSIWITKALKLYNNHY